VGTRSSGQAAISRPLLDFPYSRPEPWSWIPGTWILPGTVFVTAEGRFWRLVERLDDGWKAEEVAPATVGPQPRIAEIKGLRARYEHLLAARDALGENRSLLRERDKEMHQLRDRLILLCNGRAPEARAAASQLDRWKWALVIVLAVIFTAAAANCARLLFIYVPEQAGKMVAGAAFFLSATALAVIGVRELAKRRNKLVTGNLVGCYTLCILAVVVAAFAIMLLSVLLMYRGAYTLF